MTVAIHQPNLFPWMGFFNKIYKSDVFVLLNHVENNPRTAIYTKRVKIIVNKSEHWLTCSLKNEPGKVFVPINRMIIEKPEWQKDKHLKTFELNYKKLPFFQDTLPFIESFYNHPSEFISERNVHFIQNICEKLNIKTKMVVSENYNIQSSSNQLLIDLVKKLNGSTYMPGGGSAGYQDDELFRMNNLEITAQNFTHPVYSQKNTTDFIPGLSVIDALMNVGFKETEMLLKSA